MDIKYRVILKEKLERVGIYRVAKAVLSISYLCDEIGHNFFKTLRKNWSFRSRKFEYLKKYRKIHDGERCFIVATGPSLRIDDLDLLKGEYTFSMNSAALLYDKTEWRANYYCIVDFYGYEKLQDRLDLSKINNLFVPSTFARYFKLPPNALQIPFNYLNHRDESNVYKWAFSDDAFLEVCCGSTVTFAIMQLAVHMGFKEIYLLGVDCDYSGSNNHVVEYGHTATNPEARMLEAYKVAKKYADEHGIKIYNATRGGKLEIFERKNFDDVISK